MDISHKRIFQELLLYFLSQKKPTMNCHWTFCYKKTYQELTNLGVLGIPLLFFNSCWQNDEKRHNCGIFNNLSGADNAYCVLHSLQDITLEESQGRQVWYNLAFPDQNSRSLWHNSTKYKSDTNRSRRLDRIGTRKISRSSFLEEARWNYSRFLLFLSSSCSSVEVGLMYIKLPSRLSPKTGIHTVLLFE